LRKIPEYTDIEGRLEREDINAISALDLLIQNDGKFLPDIAVTRVEFLTAVCTCFKYLPCNVYHDVYSDVFGDEWFAGTVQSGYDNGLIDVQMTQDDKFCPDTPVLLGEAVSILLNAYANKTKRKIDKDGEFLHCWADAYLKCAVELGVLSTSNDSLVLEPLSRARAAVLLHKAVNKLLS
jgi:hypothetical protein